MAAEGKAARWLYGPGQTEAVLARADALVAGSERARRRDRAAHARRRDRAPDDSRRLPATHVRGDAPRRPMCVGWVGTAGNTEYLDPLAGVFARLAGEQVAVLEVVSSEPWSGPARFRRWTSAEEASVFARFDVGIMPLPDTPYTRAKAGFKLLQSLAAGVGVVGESGRCQPMRSSSARCRNARRHT